MATIALEGTGASIAFGTSTTFTSDLISLTLPDISVESLETTHLGTSGHKTYKPGKLKALGDISATFDHDPGAPSLVGVEQEITINYPLLAGQATAAKLVFNGFVKSQGGEEFATDTLMRTKVAIQVNGGMTYTAAVPTP